MKYATKLMVPATLRCLHNAAHRTLPAGGLGRKCRDKVFCGRVHSGQQGRFYRHGSA
jgi:hypothetical protein